MNKDKWNSLDTTMQSVINIPLKILKTMSERLKASIKKSPSDTFGKKLENETIALQNFETYPDSILQKTENKAIALQANKVECPSDSVLQAEETGIPNVQPLQIEISADSPLQTENSSAPSLQKEVSEAIALQENEVDCPLYASLQKEETENPPDTPLKKESEVMALQETETEIPADSPLQTENSSAPSDTPLKKESEVMALQETETEISADSPLQNKKNELVKEHLIMRNNNVLPVSDSKTKEKEKTENSVAETSTVSIWEQIKSGLKEQLPVHIHVMWIKPIEFIKYEANTIVIGCPNLFSKKRIQEEYRSLIKAEADRILGKPCEIIVEVSERRCDSKKKKARKTDMDPQLIMIPEPNVPILTTPDPNHNKKEILIKQNGPTVPIKGKTNGRILRKEFTFDRFVVGNSNDFAYSASLSLASQKEAAQNSLFLLSETGNGKSHLSQAIGHHILSHSPFKNISYMTAEDFTNEMVQAFRHKSADIFKEKFRTQCDVLILEDIHFLAGKEHTQTELALALDYLFDAGKKIIFTSCYLPASIPKMSEQLISRFSSGLITSIESPDFETRFKILQQKLKENGYKIPAEVTDYLAAELSENVRQLESGLIGVMAKSSLLKKPVDLYLAESVVKNIISQRSHITIDLIKELVCEHFKISVKELVSSSRRQSVLRPRQIAIYLSRKYTEHSLKVIGKNFNKYHTTVIYSIGTVEKELRTNISLQQQLDFFKNKLESGVSLERKKA